MLFFFLFVFFSPLLVYPFLSLVILSWLFHYLSSPPSLLSVEVQVFFLLCVLKEEGTSRRSFPSSTFVGRVRAFLSIFSTVFCYFIYSFFPPALNRKWWGWLDDKPPVILVMRNSEETNGEMEDVDEMGDAVTTMSVGNECEEELRANLARRDEQIHQLTEQLREKDREIQHKEEEIQQLKSHLDKFKSILFSHIVIDTSLICSSTCCRCFPIWRSASSIWCY